MFVHDISWRSFVCFTLAGILILSGCSKKDEKEKQSYYPGMTGGIYEPPRTSSATVDDSSDDDPLKKFSKEDILRLLVEIIYGEGQGGEFRAGGRQDRYRVQNRRHRHRFPMPVEFPSDWDWSQRLPLVNTGTFTNNSNSNNTTTNNTNSNNTTTTSSSGNSSASLPQLTCRIQMNKLNFISKNTLPDDLNRNAVDIIDITQEQAFFTLGSAEPGLSGLVFNYTIDIPIVRGFNPDGTPKVETLHSQGIGEGVQVGPFIPVNSSVQPTSSFVWAHVEKPGSGRPGGDCQGAVNVPQ